MPPRSYRLAGVEDRRIRRKLIKHLVEKKRRGRINQCLEELRCLVLEAMNRNPEQYSKMEKADILEMTVRYLRHNRKNASGSQTSPSSAGDASPSHVQQFHSGYRACIHEITAFLDKHSLSDDIKHRLMNKLSRGCERLAMSLQDSPPSSQGVAHVVAPVPLHMTPPTAPHTMDIKCTLSLSSPASHPGHPYAAGFGGSPGMFPSPPERMYPPPPPYPSGEKSVKSETTPSPLVSPSGFSTPVTSRKHRTSSVLPSPAPPTSHASAFHSPLWRPW